MTFGARMLKTGIAVTVSLYISSFLHISSPVIAAVAAIFCDAADDLSFLAPLS